MDTIAQATALDRGALFRRVEKASKQIRHAAIIEKDFWVCWALRRIFEVLQFRPHLIFKGGTSLSKVVRAIERFSEDVDLSLSRRDLGFADDRDPEQALISKKEARRRLDAPGLPGNANHDLRPGARLGRYHTRVGTSGDENQ